MKYRIYKRGDGEFELFYKPLFFWNYENTFLTLDAAIRHVEKVKAESQKTIVREGNV